MRIEWLADETVFSFCSRYRILSGHRLSAETSLDLFGHPRLGSAHDFPCRLDRLSARLDQRLGDSETIARNHTMLPFFLPFISEARATAAMAALRSDQVGSLKYSLGLLTTGFRAAHPLKACVACIEEDMRQFSAAPWRIPHQLPGTWFCESHRRPLVVSRLKINQTQRFLYMVPAQAELSELVENVDEKTEATAVAVARVTRQLWQAGSTRQYFDRSLVPKIFHDDLLEKGFSKRSGRVDLNAASEAFQAFCSPIIGLRDLRPLPTSHAESLRWLSRLLREPRSGMHPLRRAITIAWLFGDLDTFLDRYRSNSVGRAPTPEATRADVIDAEYSKKREQLLESISGGSSIRSAALLAGVSIQTGLALAAENGLEIQRRAQKLTPQVRNALARTIRTGLSKADIEKRFNISRPTLNRFIRSEPGLAGNYGDAIYSKELTNVRDHWTTLIKEHPTLGMKGLRLVAGKTYAWLYRHDRRWLFNNRPDKSIANRTTHRPILTERDEDLAQKIRVAALVLSQNFPERRVQLKHLREYVHELSPCLHALDRLPLTQRAIETALKRSRN